MKAYVIREPGGPEKFELEDLPLPTWKKGWVLVKVKAFGLNRAEWFTRRGDSPSVKFPRVLGIECVGEVVESDKYRKGQKVAAMMGGMGRQFDGSYAEFTLVPEGNVFPIESELGWDVLGALPEMFQTVDGSLYQGLEIERASNLVIRGGTSSIGLCALVFAKNAGLEVVSTSRSQSKVETLKSLGADHVVIDGGEISEAVKEIYPGGADRVLELIGTKTLLDSLHCTKRGGIVCMTGILGGEWEWSTFAPMAQIPTAVKLTAYSGEAADITAEKLQKYIGLVESGELKVSLGRVFSFSHLREAHQLMDNNAANGKVVVMGSKD